MRTRIEQEVILRLDVKELNKDGNRYQLDKKQQNCATEGTTLAHLPAPKIPCTLDFNDSTVHTSNQKENLEPLSFDNKSYCVPSSDPPCLKKNL